MTEAELIARYPRLYHMSEASNAASIAAHGLLSAAVLCDLHGVSRETRAAVLAARRARLVRLEAPGLPPATLRDQSPMVESKLAACLRDGLTPAQWYAMLNTRVFFWLDPERLSRLLGARAYRGRAHLVFTLSTATLLAAHRARITLSSINSGATLYVPRPRGLATFKTIADCPAGMTPVELTVQGGVPDLAAHLVETRRWHDGWT